MVEQQKIPFLFNEDDFSLADYYTYSQLMWMDFNEMRKSQIEFEKIKGKNKALSKLNNPHYLLTRGVLGETDEALEALTNKGPASEAFKREMVDILVFIGSLLNHANISQAELKQNLLIKLNQDSSINLKEIFETAMIAEAKEAISVLVSIGPNTPLFREQLIILTHLALQALEKMQISPAELNYRFAQVIIKNFVKNRPEVIKNHTVKKGMKVSRSNFIKSDFEPITYKNVTKKQEKWAKLDEEFARRSSESQPDPTLIEMPVAAEFTSVS